MTDERVLTARQYRMRQKVSKGGFSFFRFIFLVGMGFIILYPLMKQLATAFMTLSDMNDPLVTWIPRTMTLDNFKLSLDMLEFGKSITTTILFCIGMSLLQLASAALTGYGFARLPFRGSKLLFIGMLLTIIVPPQIILLPLYINFKNFDILWIFKMITGSPINMIDSPVSLFILAVTGQGLKGGLFIYIFYQFFRGIPTAMEEAAFIDGAGIWRTFGQIIMPNCKGSIITVLLFSFVWQYNDTYFTTMFFPRGNLISLKLTRISMSVQEYLNAALNAQGIAGLTTNSVNPLFLSLMASTAALVTILPLIIMYLFVQKQFTEGVEHAGIKG